MGFVRPDGEFSPKRLVLKTRAVYYAPSSVAGWSSLAARRAHNPKVVGSNPAPATIFKGLDSVKSPGLFLFLFLRAVPWIFLVVAPFSSH